MTDKNEQERLEKIANTVKERDRVASMLAAANTRLADTQPRAVRYETDVQVGRIDALKTRIASLVPGTPYRRRRIALLERKLRHRIANGEKFGALANEAIEDVAMYERQISDLSAQITKLSTPSAG